MKRFILILILASIMACGSYNSIDGFYNAHKFDKNVTAIHIPAIVLNIFRKPNREMNTFANNIRSIRFIQLQPNSDSDRLKIRNEIDGIVGNRFVEIFRKNKDDVNTLISLRERRDVVKEIIIYSHGKKNNGIFYLSGNFDPTRVRNYAKDGQLETFGREILRANNFNPEN